jgi:hypothetical protein
MYGCELFIGHGSHLWGDSDRLEGEARTESVSQLGRLHDAQWSRSPDLKRIMEDQVTAAEFAKRRCDAHGK